MPKGISESFLRLLEAERPRAVKTAVAAVVLALVGLQLADLADAPRLGRDSMTYLTLLGVGIVLGLALGRFAAHRLTDRLKTQWSHTMREAGSADSLAALDRRLRGLAPVPAWRLPLVAVGFTLANILLFALLWVDAPVAPTASLVILTADGLALGAWLGATAYRFVFARTFVNEVDGMVSRGTLGVWGEA